MIIYIRVISFFIRLSLVLFYYQAVPLRPSFPPVHFFINHPLHSQFTMQLFAFLTLFASVLSLVLVNGAPVEKRAARSFASLTISGGVGGNALAEAQAKFPGSPASLSAATAADFNVRT